VVVDEGRLLVLLLLLLLLLPWVPVDGGDGG